MKLQRKLHLIYQTLQFRIMANPELEGLDFLHLPLGSLGIVPEVRSLRAQLLFFKLHLLGVNVKIASQCLSAVGEVFILFLCNHIRTFCILTTIGNLFPHLSSAGMATWDCLFIHLFYFIGIMVKHYTSLDL